VQAQGSLLALLFFDHYFSGMDNVLDFIRDFNIADYGVTGLYFLIGFAAVVLLWEVSHRFLFLNEDPRKNQIKREGNFIFSFVVYSVFLCLMLQHFLNEEYFRAFLMLFFLMHSKNVFGRLYDGYDRFIDRVADKTT
jgi:hypothetical protein